MSLVFSHGCYSERATCRAATRLNTWVGRTATCNDCCLLVQVALLSCVTTMFFMRILGCISVLLFALAVVAEDAPTELKIDRTFVPDNCKLTAQNGDRLSVHYVSP